MDERPIRYRDIEDLKSSWENRQKLEDKLSFWQTVAGWLIFISAVLLIVVIFNTADTIIPAGYTPNECADIAIKFYKELN